MEEKIAILTDSASDLQEFAEIQKLTNAENVHVFVHFKTESFSTAEISMEDYHQRLQNISKKSEWPQTAAPAPGDVHEGYEKLKKEGYKKIISIHVAEKLSGTVNAANMAKDNIDDVEIEIIDSQSASVGELATLLKAHQLIKENLPFDEVVTKLNEFSDNSEIYVTLDTLDYLRMGGRISHVKYRLGKFLRMKPILIVKNGVIDTFDKTRDIQKSRDKVYHYVTDKFDKQDTFTYVIGHTRSLDVAKGIEDRIKENFPNAHGYIGEIGTAICTQVGPGAIGIITFE
ncbi:MAG: DegV family protein [Candidatus Kariarchaeaceae archaeon]|jgi:DegV family protein with EDD domain